MKPKILIVLICLFVNLYGSFGQDLDIISKNIKKAQLLVQPKAKDYIKCYYNLRKSSNSLKRFLPLAQRDTIFILESHGDWSSLELTTLLWNNADTLSCNSNDAGKTHELVKSVFFTNYMMKLVSEWNIEEIRKEEIQSIQMQPNYTNFATRIIFNGKKYKIDCIYFKDFFNPKRSR